MFCANTVDINKNNVYENTMTYLKTSLDTLSRVFTKHVSDDRLRDQLAEYIKSRAWSIAHREDGGLIAGKVYEVDCSNYLMPCAGTVTAHQDEDNDSIKLTITVTHSSEYGERPFKGVSEILVSNAFPLQIPSLQGDN